MTNRQAPKLATYLLQRFAARYHREALIGDLLEEHARGRSSAWYWGQVLGVLGSSAQQAIWRHRHGLIMVAAWWSILLYLTCALKEPVILFALDPSVYWWLKRRRQRREAAHRVALLVLFVCLCLPWGLPRPADAAQTSALRSPQCSVAQTATPARSAATLSADVRSRGVVGCPSAPNLHTIAP